MQDTALKSWRGLLVVICLLLAGHAVANPTLYKCVDGAGQSSYQSEPCATGRREAWSKTIVPDPPPRTSAQTSTSARDDTAPSGRSQRQGDRRARREAGTSRGERTRRRSPSRAVGARLGVTANSLSPACEAARRRREQTLERMGLKRTYALLQKLDTAVHQACG